ncbi:MAG: NAD(P)H-quinone oxidoreductase [Rhodospirillaceae bacterium]|nr:NAD(P)H-quinone oxidoreductase [Rhodospirillaceae bacterium]
MSANIPTSMKVIEITEPGAPKVLKPAFRDVPAQSDHEILIKVAAVGVNGPDIVQRRGHYPPPKGATDLLGLEVSGEVVALGKNVSNWTVGDKVCGLTNGGGYAEYVRADANHCLPIPKGLNLVEAASLPETFFTVWSNIFMGVANLQAGERFLVHGGSGGIGATAIQLGKAFGATVFTTDSPTDRCSFAKELGADQVINYNEEDFVEIVRGAGGANVILDTIGGPYVERNIKATAPEARIVQLAFNLGSKIEINLMPVMLKRLVYTGSTLRSRPETFKSEIARQLREKVWPIIEDGTIKTMVRQSLPLEQAAEAHALMESATHTGKIMLEIG